MRRRAALECTNLETARDRSKSRRVSRGMAELPKSLRPRERTTPKALDFLWARSGRGSPVLVSTLPQMFVRLDDGKAVGLLRQPIQNRYIDGSIEIVSRSSVLCPVMARREECGRFVWRVRELHADRGSTLLYYLRAELDSSLETLKFQGILQMSEVISPSRKSNGGTGVRRSPGMQGGIGKRKCSQVLLPQDHLGMSDESSKRQSKQNICCWIAWSSTSRSIRQGIPKIHPEPCRVE